LAPGLVLGVMVMVVMMVVVMARCERWASTNHQQKSGKD